MATIEALNTRDWFMTPFVRKPNETKIQAGSRKSWLVMGTLKILKAKGVPPEEAFYDLPYYARTKYIQAILPEVWGSIANQ